MPACCFRVGCSPFAINKVTMRRAADHHRARRIPMCIHGTPAHSKRASVTSSLAKVLGRPDACLTAAGTPASATYNDAADTATTPMGTPVSSNVLVTANIPSGTTAQVTGFSVAGSPQVYPAGSNVTLDDPVTGEPIGTLVLSSNGDYTFDPVPGYVGPTPAINVYSKNSNGVTDVSSLTIDVLPGTHLRVMMPGSPRFHASAAKAGCGAGRLAQLLHCLCCLLQCPHCQLLQSPTPPHQACPQQAACWIVPMSRQAPRLR